MFNYVSGNPFNQKIESALSAGQENKRQQQQQKNEDERRLLDEDDNDEISISRHPELSEDDVLYLLNEYIPDVKVGNFKSNHNAVVDYRIYRRFKWPIYVVIVGLLIAVKFVGMSSGRC